MTECGNAEIRDVLPDYVAGSLPGDVAAAVHAHVTDCIPCTEEVVLLRAMRAARPTAPAIDVARIVSMLPPPRAGMPSGATAAAQGTPVLTLHTNPQYAPTANVAAARPDVADARGAWHQTRGWRVAAAIGVVVIGGWSALAVVNDVGDRGASGSQVAAATESLGTAGDQSGGRSGRGLPGFDSGGAARVADGGAVAAAPARQVAASLSDLSVYSDDELERMLDRLDSWDGATVTEPMPAIPILAVSDRGT